MAFHVENPYRASCLKRVILRGSPSRLGVMILLLLIVTSCMGDPMAPSRKKIKLFKKNHSDQFGSHQGVHRKISYAFAGNLAKRPVILVHGSPGSREGWYSFLLEPELLSHFHLIVPDRAGYGDFDKGNSEPSLSKQAEDISSLLSLNHSGLDPILVGHSYGAPVVAKMAMTMKVHALVLVAGSIDPDLEDDLFVQKIGRLPLIRSLIPDFLRVCNEEITALKNELNQKEYDWKRIETRVFTIHGTDDDLVPVANTDFLLRKLPESKVILLKTNHFIPWNNPDSIVSLLLEQK